MDELLELASRVAEQAEVFVVESEDSPVAFETNRLKLLQSRQKKGVALRIVKDGRIGFASTTRKLDPKELIDAALDIAQFGAEAKFVLPGPLDYPTVDVYDPQVAQLAPERLVAMGQQMIDALLAYKRELTCEASLSRRTLAVQIRNSLGGHAAYRRSEMHVSLEGTLIRGTDMLFVGDADSSCALVDSYMDLARSTIHQLELAENIARISTGTYPVLFTAQGVASVFVAPLTTAFNGRSVLQGSSPLAACQGQPVFHPSFTLWDDAVVPCRPSSAICDDEGVPSRRTALVQQGVVADFFYDLQTAGLAGKTSTGNGSRSLETMPVPASTGLVIEAGDVPFDDLVGDIREGLIVEYLMGASQGNVLGGEFGGNVLLGYKIENGRIVGRVKNTMVSGNVYEALRNIAGLSKESRWVASLWTPAICCASLSVSA